MVAVKTMNPAMMKKLPTKKDRGTSSEKREGHPDGTSSHSFSQQTGTVSSSFSPTASKTFSSSLSATLSKSMSGWSAVSKENFINEIRMLSQLQEHRNIVCVMGAVIKGTKQPKMVLEYMERGSLYDLLRSDVPIGGKREAKRQCPVSNPLDTHMTDHVNRFSLCRTTDSQPPQRRDPGSKVPSQRQPASYSFRYQVYQHSN